MEQFARAKTITAVRLNATTVELQAECEISACHEGFFQVSPFLIYPPQYNLLQKSTLEPGHKCIEGMITVHPKLKISFPTDRDVVAVRDARGDHGVQIKPLEQAPLFKAAFERKGGGTHEIPTPATAKPSDIPAEIRAKFKTRSGVGYSDSFDFGEAVHAALKSLPADPKSGNIADQLYYFHVSDIGVEIGGIAGVSHLRVVVEAYDLEVK